MNVLRFKVLPWLLCLGFVHAAAAADSSAPAPLDEVLIEGRRATPDELVQQIVKVENRFYERYNELNDNDDFDVNCAWEAPDRHAAGKAVHVARCTRRKQSAPKARKPTGGSTLPSTWEPGAEAAGCVQWSHQPR